MSLAQGSLKGAHPVLARNSVGGKKSGSRNPDKTSKARSLPAASAGVVKLRTTRLRMADSADSAVSEGSSRKDRSGKRRRRRRATMRTYAILAATLAVFTVLGLVVASKLTTGSDMRAGVVASPVATMSQSGDFESFVFKGNQAFDKHRYADAGKWYRRALALNPHSIAVIIDLGTCYYYCGAGKKALGMYDRALQEDPLNKSALFNKGMVLRESGDYSEAKKAWQRYLEANPSDADVIEVKALMAGLGI